MKKNNKRIKSILQVGVITILSLAAAFPVLRNINGHDLRLNGKKSSAIYAYNAENLADIVSASFSDAGKSTAEVKPYMSYIPDVYDPDLNFKDIEKHLTDASPDEFSDPYIIEDAKFYSEQGYKLINSEYAVKYYGQGIGIGDYAFTNGFSLKDSPDDTFFVFDVVKATQDEFDAYLEEFKKGHTLVDFYDSEELTSFRTSESEPYYEVTYYKNTEVLTQETYFIYN